MGTFLLFAFCRLSGLKLSGERGDGGLGLGSRFLAQCLAVCPLGVGRPCTQMAFYGLWHAGMAGAACCMYETNYVKLSRVFAVQLFGMFIGHYAALSPVRSDFHWLVP
jgi:hypothetical protein